MNYYLHLFCSQLSDCGQQDEPMHTLKNMRQVTSDLVLPVTLQLWLAE